MTTNVKKRKTVESKRLQQSFKCKIGSNKNESVIKKKNIFIFVADQNITLVSKRL